ncbi:uncharacterized protein LOC128250705 [Octopus bimaculoides]|uniref:uncharacterized protein LOC128250705 n=1 Tax=Octopus bimaculoides TaxID=37653 RepID=UPI0022E62EAB|nr:uncharacterized protein LOC128250705 [Octopus bimaculoides]
MASNKAADDDDDGGGGGSEEEGSRNGNAAAVAPTNGTGEDKDEENGGRITRQSLSKTISNDGAKDKNVPVKKKKLSTSSSESGYSVATSRSRRLPCRPGIVWRIGERLEAMDFIHKWYPAKIVNIQEEKFSVLIHFEGWNHRYDEWVDMKCERLRPASRRSERKEKRRQMTVSSSLPSFLPSLSSSHSPPLTFHHYVIKKGLLLFIMTPIKVLIDLSQP